MNDGKRILVIDESDLLGQTLKEHLEKIEGYDCVVEKVLEQGLQRALKSYFDMIIIDMGQSHGLCKDMCRKLRLHNVVSPIIILMMETSEAKTIDVLNAGATDFVVKPFKIGVLMARIRAHIRQFEHSDDAELKIGPFAFKSCTKSLIREGRDKKDRIRLTDKESQIIKFLYLHADRVASRDELLVEIWGYNNDITTHTLETHIYRLRQKMEQNPNDAEIIVTEPGGYRLYP